ncbi:uncharacterized protein LOC124133412 isoform X2 [Haliotis rufescens]|uniref:uncharacterized protein LOC124133412 isoform X2 n=1 Tax=Haliotis rufescens TaxID=6454 RepID=UPI00201F80AF|nr:uncharacterized protein LOC124133412 isoform X2 [Haliotis rufescens]
MEMSSTVLNWTTRQIRLKMRRRCLGIRCRTGLILIILTLCLCGVYFTYKSLSGQETSHSRRRNSFPSLDKRKGLRFQAAKQRHGNVRPPDSTNDWHKEQQIMRQSLMSGSLKFNPVLQKKLHSFISELYPDDWGTARETDEVALELKSLLLDVGLGSNMSCKQIDSLHIGGNMARSDKRYVERGRFDEYSRNEVTVKSQSFDVGTKIKCMKKVYDFEYCSLMGNYKMMREILYLALLRHPTIVNMLGYCVRGDQISPEIRKKGLIVVTELGSPLSPHSLASMPWQTKVMYALQLAKLLEYLESSPIGNVALGKISMEDFIVVNNGYSLRLVDLDDMMPHEKTCSSDSDCINDGKSLGIQCNSGRCLGLNKASNMNRLGSLMMDPILRSSPASQSQRVDDILNRLLNNQISAQELTTSLKQIQDEAGLPQEPPVQQQQQQQHYQQEQPERIVQREDDPDLNRPSRNKQFLYGDNNAAKGRDRVSPGEYLRYDQSNYQGIYDFRCENSRVTWGCVLTARSIQDSQNMCDANQFCESIVIYSSQPESENLMTIILKNSSASNPQLSAGTTLFIRREGAGRPPQANNDETNKNHQDDSNNNQQNNNSPNDNHNSDQDNNNHDQQRKDQSNDQNVSRAPPGGQQPLTRDTCVKRSLMSHEEAHKSRERRLMTHLGLKGYRESDWFKAVVSQTVGSVAGITPAVGNQPKGGKVVVKFIPNGEDKMVSKALFISEKGPEQFHTSYAIVYQLDRLLGLYHTPPSMMTNLPADLVQKFSTDLDFRDMFATMLERDGTAKGLFSVPMPKVMKPEALTIKPLKTLVPSVTKFTRLMKMQLEYVFLWWLAKISKGPDSHIGYKGHMIQFDADLAFQDPLTDLTGYFFHCQFPNIVYKTLNCFRCHSPPGQPQSSSICSLGQEVISRVKTSGFSVPELQVRSYNENEFAILLNDAATVALSIVDQCVRTFGKEDVLY